MKKYLIYAGWVPAWILTNALNVVLPRSHPWRWRWMTLQSWHEYGTPFAFAMSIGIGWSFCNMLICLAIFKWGGL